MPKLEQLRQELEKLRTHYLEQLPDKLAALRHLWAQIQTQPANAATAIDRICDQLHALEGSAITFGFSELSHSANQLQSAFLKIRSGKLKLPQADEEIVRLLTLVEAHIAVPGRPELPALVPPLTPPEAREQLIYIADDDFFFAEHLRLQISFFGYRIRQFQRLEELEQAMAEEIPAAVLMDIRFPGAELGGALIMERLQRQSAAPIPLLFVSARADQEARLHAVRAGSQAYFVKPVDINELVEALDRITRPGQEEPFRVLLVEDSVALSSFYTKTLSSAGMAVRTVNDPGELLECMIQFCPEVVILDLYLPRWNGYELAAMLRQQESFVGLPIIYLSVERKLELQLKAMEHGGDDFLTKPIDPEHLIASVRHRVLRYRTLRRYMVQDSLTGLYSHSRLKELMDIEVARAKRKIAPVAYVMVDLDQFKAVNDVHGHLAGDRVLKTLARLFRQRLRRTDIVGRYGGEEFGLVLPDTSTAQAFEIVDALREAFAHIQHRGRDGLFRVSFSAGISAYPNDLTLTDLCLSADRALYQAKNGGRNRVCIAD